MAAATPWFGLAGYGLAALAYLATAILLLVGRPETSRGWLLTSSMAACGVWAAGLVALLYTEHGPGAAVVGLDAAHLFIWTLCVSSWLVAGPTRRVLVVLSGIAAVWALLVSQLAGPSGAVEWTADLTLVLMALIGLLAVEQVFRNALDEQRAALRLLCIAAGGSFAADLFVYSQAALLGELGPFVWETRGFVNAALLPLVLLGVKRQPDWQREPFVSRQVAFYTATFLGVGAYLLAMSVVAYFMRLYGGEWSGPPQVLFFMAVIALLTGVLFWSDIGARLRIFLVKHFYRDRYDYRREWLRLTQSLGRDADLQMLAESSLEALAQIVGGRRGELWLAKDSGHYQWLASLGREAPKQGVYRADHPMVSFMAATSWVIDSQEYADSPDRYRTAFGAPADSVLPPDSLVVPLDCQGYLQGFVILEKPAATGALNFEDHDILKTAGKQVGVALAQSLALEKLAETRQFEAMNKMSTFLMHDLKNIIAQQQLVVANAARFRQRPEFFDDAIATVRSGVERMRRLIEQIERSPANKVGGTRADLSKVLIEVRSHCADRHPIPEIQGGDTTVWVAMDRDKLVSALTHLVRNAQDATPGAGRISISVAASEGAVVCSVSDTGCGMDQQFMRDRLFRPFDSTKGAEGMGIGAYQVREMVRGAGGDVEVSSEPAVGTIFRLRLPLAAANTGAGAAGAVAT